MTNIFEEVGGVLVTRRVMTNNPVNYQPEGAAPGVYGWYFDFDMARATHTTSGNVNPDMSGNAPPAPQFPGEKAIRRLVYRDGTVITTTILPATGEASCFGARPGAIMLFDVLTGGDPGRPVVDFNNDGEDRRRRSRQRGRRGITRRACCSTRRISTARWSTSRLSAAKPIPTSCSSAAVTRQLRCGSSTRRQIDSADCRGASWRTTTREEWKRCETLATYDLRLCGFADHGLTMTAAEAAYPEKEGIGYIESIDFEASTLIVNGLRFRVPSYAKVAIDGTFGAFTLLREGMLIHYDFQQISPTEREIFELETRPKGERYESS